MRSGGSQIDEFVWEQVGKVIPKLSPYDGYFVQCVEQSSWSPFSSDHAEHKTTPQKDLIKKSFQYSKIISKASDNKVAQKVLGNQYL